MIFQAVKLGVVERMKSRCDGLYTTDNILLSVGYNVVGFRDPDFGAARSTERGDVPNRYGAGSANAAVLNQRLSVCTLDGSSGLPTRSGRIGPAGNAFVRFDDDSTEKGAPD